MLEIIITVGGGWTFDRYKTLEEALKGLREKEEKTC